MASTSINHGDPSSKKQFQGACAGALGKTEKLRLTLLGIISHNANCL
jgi:hypothetical protein